MHQVYSYIRVSGKSQVTGDGPDRQRDAISAFCKAHRLLPMGEFFDKAVSGTVEGMERPEFSDMLERIPHMERNGIHIEAIVVERVDRLARDLMVSELLLAECRKRGIKVFSVDQSALIDVSEDGGDPTRVLIRQIMGALAQWEKSVLVKKLRLARDRVRARTGRCEGAKPYGTFKGEPEIIAYLKAVHNLNEKPSYQAIANGLNAAGLRNRAGRKWTKGPVWGLIKKLLDNGTL